jgi:hydrogenase/urease accessory protein HupE
MSGAGVLGGFFDGLLDPFLATAHAVALLALGLTVGQQKRWRWPLLMLALGLIGGLATLASGAGETPANTVLLATAGAAGLAAAIARPLPAFAAAALTLVAGAAIGLDSPPRVFSIQAANAALLGTALAAFSAVAAVAAIVAWMDRGVMRIGPRVAGSWVTASAILVLALRFAR